ncbi:MULTISPECIES: type I-E CRISPR-associated protein Cse2/CasB [Corynebacterium]|uniref:type I-E CRISPR-associated protein Cse2/CasB n=1 Tax=Corynebacterium TaxID=1716 RepID=UPI000A9D63FF|nr:type I-E CRISPR-associated protein Cse2/CasB [Corynebacterium sp. S1S1]AYX80783.1 type I-E CRISPR-associated protein Cse2/CasB [Corynebacterium jeikeium]
MADTNRSQSRSSLLYSFVAGKAQRLAGGLANESSEARASLAVLRRSLSAPLAEQPQVWSEVFNSFPAELEGPRDEPGVYETAAHLALAFFALHQQSRNEPMHKANEGFGTAMCRLHQVSGENQKKGIERRFNAALTAQTTDELVHHLRGLIQMLRSYSIPMDYGQLANDLVALNYSDSARRVRLRWARDMNRVPQSEIDDHDRAVEN